MTPSKLSPSSLSLMKECPRCFWLTQHKVWKRPAGIFPSLPSGMDGILKKHFESFAKQGILPPELCKGDECARLKLFDDFKKLEKWQNNRIGIQFKDKDGNLLRGAVDYLLVQTLNEKLIVIDYKTRGFPLKEDTAAHYQDQLDIYNFLLRKNGYKTEDFAFLLFYIPKEILPTGEVIFDTELKRMNIDVGNAEKIWKKAIALLDGDCPDKMCVWCEGV
jgi:hypothetical protein